MFDPAPGGGTSNAQTFTVTAPTPSAPTETSTYYLAEGTTSYGFETYVTIQNPNYIAVTAQVTYMTGAGAKKGARHKAAP